MDKCVGVALKLLRAGTPRSRQLPYQAAILSCHACQDAQLHEHPVSDETKNRRRGSCVVALGLVNDMFQLGQCYSHGLVGGPR